MSNRKIAPMINDQFNAKLDRLEALARDYSEKHHSEWPTVRDLARQLRVRQADVIEMAEASEHLDMCVGVQISGGGGWYAEEKESDYSVEWVE